MSRYCRVEKQCLQCSKTIFVLPSVLKKGHGLYCSNSCKNLFNWAKTEYRQRMSDAHKGQVHGVEKLVAYNRTAEGRLAISRRMAGNKPWNRGEGINQGGYRRRALYGTESLEHRQVMSYLVGRPLKNSEVVHHWDKVKTNNAPSNLCLMRSGSAHSRLHHFADRHGIHIKELRFEQPWLTPNEQ